MEQKKIAHIHEKHPWFWMVKEIILEQPSLVPTGIGNYESGFDLSQAQKRVTRKKSISSSK